MLRQLHLQIEFSKLGGHLTASNCYYRQYIITLYNVYNVYYIVKVIVNLVQLIWGSHENTKNNPRLK